MKLWWRNAFDTREGDAQGADEGTAHLLLAGEAVVFRNGAICPLVLWSWASVMNAGIFTLVLDMRFQVRVIRWGGTSLWMRLVLADGSRMRMTGGLGLYFSCW